MQSSRQRLWRELLHLAWPVLIAQLAVMANGLIDTMMAGRLSPVDLAAVGIGASIYASVFVAMMGVLLALPPTIAHLYGAGRHAEIGEEVRQGAWLAAALACLTLAVLTHPTPGLALSELRPDVELKVRAYLDALSWGVPAQLAFRVFYGFSTGIARPRPVMLLNLAGLALKLPLNLIFIYGYFGMPAMGAAGCGVASSIVAWTVCLAAWGWASREADYRIYNIFTHWSLPHRAQLAALLKLGLPIGATFLVDVTAFTFMALFIARLGPTASGAHQIAANLAALLYMLPLSTGNAVGILVGQSLGRGDPAAARRIGRTGLALGIGGAILVSVLLTAGKDFVASLYTRDAEVRLLAARLIAIVAIYHLADGLQAVAVNLVRGYKKALVPMLIYAVFLWGLGLAGGVAIGLGDVFAPPLGAPGFWYAATCALSLAGLLVLAYWSRIAGQAVRAPLPNSSPQRERG